MVEEIIANKGILKAKDASDKHILRIYEQALKVAPFPIVIENTKDNEFLAVTQIKGPDWYFITVYPKLLLCLSG